MKTKHKPYYLLHVYEDKDLLKHIKSTMVRQTKKLAKKDMMDLASLHLTQGLYYFYELVEQKTTTIQVYPSTETSE
jgi:hypothetical protein